MPIERQRDQWPHRREAMLCIARPGPKGYPWQPGGELDESYLDKFDIIPGELGRRRRFSPDTINPPSDSEARPITHWKRTPPPQPTLDLDVPQGKYYKDPDLYNLGAHDIYEVPGDRAPQRLYRGILVDLAHPDLAPVRRRLYGDDHENEFGDLDHQWVKSLPTRPFIPSGITLQDYLPGMPLDGDLTRAPKVPSHDPHIAQLLLDHIEKGFKSPFTHQMSLGRHWSTDLPTAHQFSGLGMSNREDIKLPLSVVVGADWMGHGEDPYRRQTGGDFPEEHEVTMLPGAPLHVQEMHLEHPKTGELIPLQLDPQHRNAGLRTAADWSGPRHLHTPLMPGEDRYEFYHPTEYTNRHQFSPTEYNPPAKSKARPTVRWEQTDPEQDTLDLDLPTHFNVDRGLHPVTVDTMAELSRGNTLDGTYPVDRKPTKLYRGVMLNMRHPDLHEVHRALWGPEYSHPVNFSEETGNPGLFPRPEHTPDPRGYANPELGQKILDHISNWHPDVGMGIHWTTDHKQAGQFAGGSYGDNQPAIISAEWMGRGEDPYRTDVGGNYHGEKEITMMPGAPLRVTNVHLKHPDTGRWHSVFDGPGQNREASR